MSQFDQDCITYTQEGRLLQLEYAVKAVEAAEYTEDNLGLSLGLSAKTESFLERKSKLSQNCLSSILTAGFSTWIAVQELLLLEKFQMADTWQYMLVLKRPNITKISVFPSLGGHLRIGFLFT